VAKGKPAGENEEDDPFKDWTPDQEIPDEEGEAAARRKSVLDLRAAHLMEEQRKKKKKKSSGLW
jgi:hypothetical protein